MSDTGSGDTHAIRITFNNGEQRSFAFEPQHVDPSLLVSRFKEHLERGFLLLETRTGLTILPMHGIRAIELDPKPDGNLPHSLHIHKELSD